MVCCEVQSHSHNLYLNAKKLWTNLEMGVDDYNKLLFAPACVISEFVHYCCSDTAPPDEVPQRLEFMIWVIDNGGRSATLNDELVDFTVWNSDLSRVGLSIVVVILSR